MKTPVQAAKNGISIRLYVQPGASKSDWAGVMGDALKLRIAAKPVDGEANKEICRFLSDYFGVAKSNIVVAQGSTGRNKIVVVSGDEKSLRALCAPLLASADQGT